MLKQIAWNTFKSTGNINTLLELLEVDKTLEQIDKSDGVQNESSIMQQFRENLKKSNEDNKFNL